MLHGHKERSMAFHSPQEVSPAKDTELTTEDNTSLHAARTQAHVAMALSVLDSRYKENLASYADELHECSHRIETARIELDMLKEKKKPYLDALIASEKEVDYEMRMLERLSEQFIQNTLVSVELEKELARMEKEESTQSSLLYRKDELNRLQREIEDLELSLLQHELERQNHKLALEPIEQQIRTQEKLLRELESEKRYIESSHLHRITQVASVDEPTLLADKPEEESDQ